MGYYNYHAIAKHLIKSGNCLGATIFSRYHHIYPALVLYFDNHIPIPIREYRWEEYLKILQEAEIKVVDKR